MIYSMLRNINKNIYVMGFSHIIELYEICKMQ